MPERKFERIPDPTPSLEWMKLYVSKLVYSRFVRTQMQDFQRWWYFSLLCEAWLSSRPGYLAYDEASLHTLAGSQSKAFFWKNCTVVLDRFEVIETQIGLWMVNRKLREVYEVQLASFQKKEKKDSPLSLPLKNISVIEIQELNTKVEELFAYYMKRLADAGKPRTKGYRLNEGRRHKAQLRFLELTESFGNEAEAAAAMRKAIDNLADNTYNLENGYIDWEDHLFGSDKILQKRLAMEPAALGPKSVKTGNCDSHPNSGLTTWGTCWGCYSSAG